MRRSSHGAVFDFETFVEARDAVADTSAEKSLGFAVAARRVVTEDFGFLLPELQDEPDNLLPESTATRNDLIALGQAMEAGGPGASRASSGIPAAYTYFGQLVDHDITLDLISANVPNLVDEDLAPLSREDIEKNLQNGRTATLELDSVYGPPAPRDPRDGKKMEIGTVAAVGGRPDEKDDFNDLPRGPESPDPAANRAAKIGDPRNDENLIVAQMHVAFLRAHNELVERGAKFLEARRRIRRHYQYIVLHDFLKRIVDHRIVGDVIENGNRIYDPDAAHLFMPLEFSVAAYRFGHSMVRADYNFNVNFPTASLDDLFMFTQLSGEMAGLASLPENWIIQWENMVPGFGEFDRASRIDTNLVNPLAMLKNTQGQTLPELQRSLAARNLLRGYLLRLPTGQAVARALRRKLKGVRDVPVLKPAEIRAAANNRKQVEVLDRAGFLNRTPLWYYVLAEAALLGGGRRLGPVGGTIVAEVLVGLLRRSEDSILRRSGWEPSLPSAEPGKFTLSDLLKLAGVLAR
jgi:hypothetical protein